MINTYIQAKEFYLQERKNNGLPIRFNIEYTPSEKKSTQDKNYWVLKNTKGILLAIVDLNDIGSSMSKVDNMKKEKQNRLMQRLDKIDAEYEDKIDKIKAEWKNQTNIVLEQIMQLRSQNNE